MHSYGVGEVARMLHLSRGTIRGLISRGFVNPARGPRREYRFSFQDLVTLRAARALVQAKVPPRRIGRSLLALRRQLPKSVPLTGFTICAVGNEVVVRRDGSHWQPESGQYLLELDVSIAGDSLQITEIKRREEDVSGKEDTSVEAHTWFERGLAAEGRNVAEAVEAYERCLALDVRQLAARVNVGRLHHEAGRLAEAERVYREALRECEPDPTLLFNLAVLLEDTARTDEAIEVYQQALAEDPDFADAHFNIARLYEAAGKRQHAIRHLGVYRRLQKS
ncbi:MAG TPA: tetratricopeptide repeat protein [Steroidobacteraceae bacterium]|nr:tetratricopeptide repeat protein [Steroidobacteraceae bacterium]